MKKWAVCLFAVLVVSIVPILSGADFDGNGQDDICVYRPSNNRWYIRGVPNFRWGDPGDIPAFGDYNGDGTDECWIFRPSEARWYVRQQGSIPYGAATDIPIAGGGGTTGWIRYGDDICYTSGDVGIGTTTPSYQFHSYCTDAYSNAGYFQATGENSNGIRATGHIYGYAGRFENPGGSSRNGIYVDGTLVCTGSKAGYVVDIALNEGPEYLETGDVVVITGADEPVVGGIPVVRARIAEEAGSTGVAGVVDQPFSVPETPKKKGGRERLPQAAGEEARLADDTGIAPGEYFTMVTLGSYKAVKADASYGAIEPGDLLVSSGTAGHAMRDDDPRVGTVVGKALEPLSSGTGVIEVLVTLN